MAQACAALMAYAYSFSHNFTNPTINYAATLVPEVAVDILTVANETFSPIDVINGPLPQLIALSEFRTEVFEPAFLPALNILWTRILDQVFYLGLLVTLCQSLKAIDIGTWSRAIFATSLQNFRDLDLQTQCRVLVLSVLSVDNWGALFRAIESTLFQVTKSPVTVLYQTFPRNFFVIALYQGWNFDEVSRTLHHAVSSTFHEVDLCIPLWLKVVLFINAITYIYYNYTINLVRDQDDDDCDVFERAEIPHPMGRFYLLYPHGVGWLQLLLLHGLASFCLLMWSGFCVIIMSWCVPVIMATLHCLLCTAPTYCRSANEWRRLLEFERRENRTAEHLRHRDVDQERREHTRIINEAHNEIKQITQSGIDLENLSQQQKGQITQLKVVKEQLEVDKIRLATETNRVKCESKELVSQYEELVQRLERQNEQLKSAHQRLQAEEQRLSGENQRLQGEKYQLGFDYDKLEGQNMGLNYEVAISEWTKVELRQSYQRRIRQLEDRISALPNQAIVSALQSQFSQEQTANSTLQASNESLSTKLQDANDEIMRLSNLDLQKENDELKTTRTRLSNKYLGLVMKWFASDLRKDSRIRQLGAERAHFIEQFDANKTQFIEQVQAQVTQFLDSKTQEFVVQKQDSDKHYEAAMVRIRQLEADKTQLITSKQQELATQKQQSDVRVEQVEANMRRLEGDKIRLQDENQRFKDECTTLKEAKRDVEELKDRIMNGSITNNEKNRSLRGDIGRLEAENRRLVGDNQSSLDRERQLQAENQRVRAEFQGLEAINRQLVDDKQSSMDRQSHLQAENQRLQGEHRGLRAEKDTSDLVKNQQLEQSEVKIKGLTHQYDYLVSEATALNDSHTRQLVQLEQQHKHIGELQCTITELDSKLRRALQDIEDLKNTPHRLPTAASSDAAAQYPQNGEGFVEGIPVEPANLGVPDLAMKNPGFDFVANPRSNNQPMIERQNGSAPATYPSPSLFPVLSSLSDGPYIAPLNADHSQGSNQGFTNGHHMQGDIGSNAYGQHAVAPASIAPPPIDEPFDLSTIAHFNESQPPSGQLLNADQSSQDYGQDEDELSLDLDGETDWPAAMTAEDEVMTQNLINSFDHAANDFDVPGTMSTPALAATSRPFDSSFEILVRIEGPPQDFSSCFAAPKTHPSQFSTSHTYINPPLLGDPISHPQQEEPVGLSLGMSPADNATDHGGENEPAGFIEEDDWSWIEGNAGDADEEGFIGDVGDQAENQQEEGSNGSTPAAQTAGDHVDTARKHTLISPRSPSEFDADEEDKESELSVHDDAEFHDMDVERAMEKMDEAWAEAKAALEEPASDSDDDELPPQTHQNPFTAGQFGFQAPTSQAPTPPTPTPNTTVVPIFTKPTSRSGEDHWADDFEPEEQLAKRHHFSGGTGTSGRNTGRLGKKGGKAGGKGKILFINFASRGPREDMGRRYHH